MMSFELQATTDDMLARMLRRLPQSLWDTDPASNTLQRDLYQAMAAQCALWLEQREIARTMTLMREAEGVDLDVLLADYGLRRYLQRPDAYARQVGMQILWTAQGTLYSVAQLADLLFELPHATLRTGRSHQHVFVAATHPVTTPYSYWGLVSAEGLWYALTVDGGVPVISQRPPPGIDVSPGPHTLTWFTVQDALGAEWYVSIHGDTLRVETTPPAGHGTREPFAVLDGLGQRWFFAMDLGSAALMTVLDTGLAGFGFWDITAQNGTLYHLWIEAEVPMIATTAPGGATNQTPGGGPLAWFTVLDDHATPWYVTVQDTTLFLQSTTPGGLGTDVLPEFLDVTSQRWILSVHSGSAVVVATAVSPFNADLVVVAPEGPFATQVAFQAFQLVDSASVPWWLCIEADTLLLTATLPAGAADVTPAGGPYHWWRLYDLAGTLWYAWPSTMGILVVETASPGGSGTVPPQELGDANGVLWHVGVDPAGNFGLSDAPPIDLAGRATAICMTDALGGRWFWRVHGHVLEWSSVLWPDTIDQSPWGELGWLQMLSTAGNVRYVFPTPLGDPTAAAGPPLTSPWGWKEPIELVDAAGTPWQFDILPDDRVGILPGLPDDIPLPSAALRLDEALEAFAHIQAAGSLVTLLVT
jgi:hypothetical protein